MYTPGIYYKFIDKKIIKTASFIEWALWFETADRHIHLTKVHKGIEVSTVFLGIDHGHFAKEPVLFETMVFGGNFDGFTRRYSNLEQAEKGHFETIGLCESQFIHLTKKDQIN